PPFLDSPNVPEGPRNRLVSIMALDDLRAAMAQRHLAGATRRQYLGWAARFMAFHGYLDPHDLRALDVREFLTHLACDAQVGSSAQNQAFSALVFLFRNVLGVDLEGLQDVPRARLPSRLPVVLTREEVQAVLRVLKGVTRLVASIMYGSGLSVSEALALCVKDVEFA